MPQNNTTDQDIQISNFWNERFGRDDFFYGKEPNAYFRSVIDKLPAGRLLVPGAGEGRDAVYAATRGWEVHCLDLSDQGRRKAILLAAESGVSISYHVGSIADAHYPAGHFDMIASIFFHLPPQIRNKFYTDSLTWLRTGGLFLMEAFTPAQLSNTSGGPKDISMLVDPAQLAADLAALHTLKLSEEEPILNEGPHHSGKANVVDYLGLRK
jgi:hypothetical protein